jgi:hypothetical protein
MNFGIAILVNEAELLKIAHTWLTRDRVGRIISASACRLFCDHYSGFSVAGAPTRADASPAGA